MRHDPSDESKCTKTRPDVIWKPECNKCKGRDVGKKAIPSDCPAIGGFAAFRLVQCPEENSRGQ